MKYAIVTGGTKGIGREVAQDLLTRGYFVFVTYGSSTESALEADRAFSEISSNYCIHGVNHASSEQLSLFVNEVRSRTSSLHCFIGNAGNTIRKSFTEITNQEWEELFQINLHSNFYLLRDLDSLFVQESSIVFIGSLMGIYPHGVSVAYGVTKAALKALAENLVKEYASRKIRVNVVAPGFVDTEWQKNKPQEIRHNIEKKTALERFATVGEISSAVMFCLDNKFINGATLEIDGGYCYK